MTERQKCECPYCHNDTWADKSQLKQHLLQAHFTELSEFAKPYKQGPKWAAGVKAAYACQPLQV